MKKIWIMLWAAVLASNVWADTYSYTGGTYIAITNHTTSALGSVGDYLNTMKVTGTLTTAAPLAANLAGANVTAQITAYSFSDGLTTFASTDANIRLYSNIIVSTNATGQIIGLDALIERWQSGSAPHAVNDRFDYILISGAATNAYHNDKCGVIGVSSSGVADSCTSNPSDTNTSSAGSGGGGVWSGPVAGTVSTVPTLSEWGVIILTFFIAMFGMAQSRYRQTAQK
ncbi:IPTL-CTERM sorting domain-containing protein [Rhodoferax sp.]|uniref:IPTL-CTERM sorting domain-containing protein n=1 Tax=Rhodoferax sp. TaxID=50421 RepID=UPI0026129B43|nr:IPTL-CTERM sorting domain-containing protein [Rhodoferax sp.]MDD2925012.1 IPTL-CTERM sorting domain-containing protein [Rhodoferax sp.]